MDMLHYLAQEEQEEQEAEKPPSRRPRPARPWRVAVIANVKGETALPADAPPDAGAEFDRRETIQAIQDAIESDGHTTRFLSADTTLLDSLREYRPDLCFNIAEGIMGDGREAQVPALLEMLRIPYTASRVLANAVGLDKTMTKRIWRDHGIPSAPFQEFNSAGEPLSAELAFPLFVKPAREGTGMGMDQRSIVHTETELRERVDWVVRRYHQPALVEAFLPGREFTVGVLGRTDAARWTLRPDLYRADGFHRFPILEVDNHNTVTPGVYGNAAKSLHPGDAGIPSFLCPAPVEPALAEELCDLAIRAHQAIGALDVSRVDVRLDAEGRPRLLEINTLPGLTPGFSDLCVLAAGEGLSYTGLLLEILYLGASRFGLLDEPALQPQPARRIHVPLRRPNGRVNATPLMLE
jgi:D-alanine-D-alanine ligase